MRHICVSLVAQQQKVSRHKRQSVWVVCNRQQDTGRGKLFDFLSRHHCLPPSCQPRLSMRGMHVISQINLSFTFITAIVALSPVQLSATSFHAMRAFTEKESGTFSLNTHYTASHADGAGCTFSCDRRIS